MKSRVYSFIKEARRRRVFRVAAFYVVGAWIVLQVAALAFPAIDVPEYAIRYVWICLFSGLPIAAVFGWRYDLKDGKVVRSNDIGEEPDLSLQRIDYAVIASLLLILVAVLLGTVGEILQSQRVDDREGVILEVDPKSIAVLPFVNRSSDASFQFFADGISEELLNVLARTPALRVTSRTSSFSFRGKDLSTPEIAERLHVAHVLEGSVRRTNNTIRITAQLVDARDDSYLWTDAYDLTIDEVFAVQGAIAGAVADRLRVALLGGSTLVGTTNSQAYVLYLQARYIHAQQTEDSFQKAEQLLRESISLDPLFSKGWFELCRLYSNLALSGETKVDEAFGKALDSCNQALNIDPAAAAVLAEIGWLDYYVGTDYEKAAQNIQRAWELEPENEYVMSSVASFLQDLGRVQDSIRLRQRLVSLDPVNPISYYNLGAGYLLHGNYGAARSNYLKVIELSSDFLGGWYALGLAELMMGDAESALQRFDLEVDELFRLKGRALAYAVLGNQKLARDALNELVSTFGNEWPGEIAHVYAFLDDPDNAFHWLSFEDSDGSGWAESRQNPLYLNIVDDPRWHEFVTRLGVSDNQLSRIQFDVVIAED